MTHYLTNLSDYTLPPSLQDLHRKTIEWESFVELWKRELTFFKKLINRYGSKLNHQEHVKEREHLKFLLAYYSGDLMKELSEKILHHETCLKPLVGNVERQDETSYREEHAALKVQLDAFRAEFQCYKNELYTLIEKVMISKN